eukprot:19578_1
MRSQENQMKLNELKLDKTLKLSNNDHEVLKDKISAIKLEESEMLRTETIKKFNEMRLIPKYVLTSIWPGVEDEMSKISNKKTDNNQAALGASKRLEYIETNYGCPSPTHVQSLPQSTQSFIKQTAVYLAASITKQYTQLNSNMEQFFGKVQTCQIKEIDNKQFLNDCQDSQIFKHRNSRGILFIALNS